MSKYICTMCGEPTEKSEYREHCAGYVLSAKVVSEDIDTVAKEMVGDNNG